MERVDTVHLFSTQDDYMWCDDPCACWIGGRGCGKTFTAALWVVHQVMEYPASHGVVASSTNPQLKQATIPDFLFVFDMLGLRYKYNEWNGTCRFQNGSWFKFQSLDVPEDQVKGGNLDWLLVDEVDACPEGHIKKLKMAVRSLGGSRKTRFIGNSPPPKHWLEKWFLPNVAASFGREVMGPLFQSSTYENHLLPPDFMDQILKDNPVGTPDYRRWVLGEMGVPLDGMVYPEFDPGKQVIPWGEVPWDRARGYVNGLDFGYNHHTVFLRGMVDELDRLFVFAEHAGRMKLLHEHSEAIHAMLKVDPGALGYSGTTYADHDLQDRAEMREMGIDTVPAVKKDLMAGIDAVRRRLREGKLFFVEDRTPKLMLEFPYYVMDEKKDKPVAKDDHALDALRYMVGGLDLIREDEIPMWEL